MSNSIEFRFESEFWRYTVVCWVGSFVFLYLYSELNIFPSWVVRPARFNKCFVLFGKNLNLFLKRKL
ncbi:hypothetical protein LEP1GSC032_1320 [Leptospira interrogans str. 2002000631]|uniref:Uncharacterized protein n=1 Tax=Leptospira interrogans str. 2002000626 TaxID=996803 RepID=A0A829CWU7_LEPIR|nr:hypothetical protein LEP1GSC027_2569 [Leptospira interrogans str. 2002000624]EMJ83364.1 hypothetical protein LEP1GSC032_1320 [Leptospira interrogans str. 2002000631]EMY04522.1 hypothetical protein LEP1GSC029_3876 [Leptospira interrogans str. 2002000626]